MFERYTERARRVLFFARYEASQLGSISIETEHLLLGLVREGKGVTSRVFARAHVSLENIRKEVEGRTVFRPPVSTSVEIPFSPEAKRVLLLAAEESDRLLHTHIGTEHLLLGILREERSVAASILMEKGMRIDAVRDQIVQLLRNKEQFASESDAPRPSDKWATYAPNIPPSSELRVLPSSASTQGHATTSGPDYWTASGFTLRSILARLFNIDERRIDLPKELDTDERYAFALRLPQPEGWTSIERRAQQGVERHFRISAAREPREQGVYILSAPGGPGSGLHADQSNQGGGGGVGFGSFDFATRATEHPPTVVPPADRRVSFGNLRMSGLTIDDLCVTLEEMFARAFVNETGLTGRYDLTVNGEFSGPDAFFAAMKDQLGLVVTPARRAVETLVVRQAT
jgi:uncharacterized protein (TIGR03435 family)